MLELMLSTFDLASVQRLFAAGGVVLIALAVTAFVLWSMLLAKVWALKIEFPKLLKAVQQNISHHQLRQTIWQAQLLLNHSMGMIRTTINVCPLLGLTGTVVGMIEIFDVISYSGVANAQIMAGAVARAILPTMAGMVIAISAMFLFVYLQRLVAAKRLLLERLSLQLMAGKFVPDFLSDNAGEVQT